MSVCIPAMLLGYSCGVIRHIFVLHSLQMREAFLAQRKRETNRF